MRKYAYPAGYQRVKIGDRFKVIAGVHNYSDKTFPIGSKVTFLGWRLWPKMGDESQYRWPKFQFDGDDHKQRIVEFENLKPI